MFGTDVTCTPNAVGASLTTGFDRARCNFSYAQSVTKGKQGSGSDPVNWLSNASIAFEFNKA